MMIIQTLKLTAAALSVSARGKVFEAAAAA
jgi:hypothetical protein